MHIYPSQMYALLIEPRATEPDYTKKLSHIEECTYTEGRCPPC